MRWWLLSCLEEAQLCSPAPYREWSLNVRERCVFSLLQNELIACELLFIMALVILSVFVIQCAHINVCHFCYFVTGFVCNIGSFAVVFSLSCCVCVCLCDVLR